MDGRLLSRLNEEALITLSVNNDLDRCIILENVKRYKFKSVALPHEEPSQSATSRVAEWLSENKKYVLPQTQDQYE